MTPKLTLFRANKACSLTPHVLLRELNIPFETVLMIFSPNGVKSADGSLTSETYRKIHPEGFIPALRTDDQVITENPAITTYIASLAPERNLFGKDDLERAMVYHWLCWLSGTLHGYAYAMILRPGRFSADEGAHAGIVQQGRKKVEECYARIEWSVQGEHIVGDALTIADVNLYIFWVWGQWHGFEMAKRFPQYGTLIKGLERMKSVRATLEVEELPLQFA